MAIKAVFLVVLLGAALALGVAAGFAGAALAAGGDGRAIALMAIRAVLGGLLVALLFFPVLRSAQHLDAGGERLLLLPVSLRQLHTLELGAAFADPWLFVVVPAIVVLGAVPFGGALAVGATTLAAALLLLVALASLTVAAGHAAQLLLRDRRRSEIVTVLLVLIWTSIALLPAYLDHSHRRRPATGPGGGTTRSAPAPVASAAPPSAAARTLATAPPEVTDRLARAETFPWYLQVLPTEAFARTLAASTGGAATAAALGLASLGLEAGLLYALSVLLWKRLVASPATVSGRRGAAAAALPTLALPGFSPAALAVAFAQAAPTTPASASASTSSIRSSAPTRATSTSTPARSGGRPSACTCPARRAESPARRARLVGVAPHVDAAATRATYLLPAYHDAPLRIDGHRGEGGVGIARDRIERGPHGRKAGAVVALHVDLGWGRRRRSAARPTTPPANPEDRRPGSATACWSARRAPRSPAGGRPAAANHRRPNAARRRRSRAPIRESPAGCAPGSRWRAADRRRSGRRPRS